MNCKIHELIKDSNGLYWVVISSDCDIFSNRKWRSKGWLAPASGEHFNYWGSVLLADLGLINHKKIEYNGKDYLIVSLLIPIEGTHGLAETWKGLFHNPQGDAEYQELKKLAGEPNDYESRLWYMIPVEEYLTNEPLNEVNNSYTEGYKLGYTGLRWL